MQRKVKSVLKHRHPENHDGRQDDQSTAQDGSSVITDTGMFAIEFRSLLFSHVPFILLKRTGK
jgi:hypothetical protein